jgi:iron complex outermembrane receptor protein
MFEQLLLKGEVSMNVFIVKSRRTGATALAVLGSLIASSWITLASAQESERDLEEIVVTGSYIKRTLQDDSAAAIQILGSQEMQDIGATSLPDIVNTLTVNTGAQVYANNLEQPRNAGTTNINLRGLGEASTLVLLNGTRTTWTPAVNISGDQYVDLSSLLPMIAVERVEILKDGASALYGSDAVAGVVNFVTRDNFEGLEVRAEASFNEHDSEQFDFGIIIGGRHDRGNFMAAFNYLTVSPVTNAERWPDYKDTQNSITGFGNPSSIFNGPQRFVDPQCDAVGNQFPGLVFDAFLCRLRFGFYGNVISDEERQQGYASGSYELNDNHEFFGEMTFARNEITIGSVPTQPVTDPVYVPENHPDLAIFAPGDPDPYVDVSQTNPDNGDLREVQWFGRVRGAGHPQNNDLKPYESWRTKAGLRGSVGDNWDYEVSFAYSINETSSFRLEAVQSELQQALYGRGGPNRDEFFRFAWDSQDLNSPELMEGILGFYGYQAEANQKVFDARISGDLFEMGGRTVGAAFGVQSRTDELIYDYNDRSEEFAFSFFIGGADFEAEQDTTAVFGEIALPFSDDFTVNLSARWEEIESETSTDPKVSFLWTATDELSFRGSWGTSFRVPSLFSQGGSFFDAGAGQDPQGIPGANDITYREESAINPTTPLVPQEATTFNVGATFTNDSGITASIDYWNFDYDGYITYESSSAVLEADTDPGNPSPQVLRDSNTGTVVQVTRYAANAGFLKTDGIDLQFSWALDTDGVGTFTPFFESTHLLSYDMDDPTSGKIDGLGLRNLHNIGAPAIETRANLGVRWNKENHSANIIARYIGGYDSDESSARLGGQIPDPADYLSVKSHTVIDLQYSVSVQGLLGNDDNNTVIRLGMKNAAGEVAPLVFGTAGYDERVHNPTGRWTYINLTHRF